MNEKITWKEKCMDWFFYIFHRKWYNTHKRNTLEQWNLEKQEDLSFVHRKRIFH